MPLKPSGPDADQLAGGQQPLGVRVAGQRVAGLAGDRAEDRHVGRPGRRRASAGGRCAGWSSCSATAVISASSGDGAGVVGDHQRAAGVRDVLACRASRRGTTSRRAAAAAGASTLSVRSGSKPKSSTRSRRSAGAAGRPARRRAPPPSSGGSAAASALGGSGGRRARGDASGAGSAPPSTGWAPADGRPARLGRGVPGVGRRRRRRAPRRLRGVQRDRPGRRRASAAAASRAVAAGGHGRRPSPAEQPRGGVHARGRRAARRPRPARAPRTGRSARPRTKSSKACTVVQRGVKPNSVAQPGGVDDPAEVRAGASARARSRRIRAAASSRPTSADGGRAAPAAATRPARRIACESSSTPSPPTLNDARAGRRPRARSSTASASSSCSSCSRGVVAEHRRARPAARSSG